MVDEESLTRFTEVAFVNGSAVVGVWRVSMRGLQMQRMHMLDAFTDVYYDMIIHERDLIHSHLNSLSLILAIATPTATLSMFAFLNLIVALQNLSRYVLREPMSSKDVFNDIYRYLSVCLGQGKA